MAGHRNEIGLTVFLKNLLVALLLPPFGLVTLALAGLILQRWRPLFGTALLWIALIGLVCLAMPAVTDTALVGLEQRLPMTPPAGDPPQAIVVLGAEVTRNAGGPSDVNVGRLTLERLRTAAELHRKTGLPILVTGGTTQPDTPPVGTLMAESLKDDFQIPARWTETESRDTWENAADSAKILHADGIHSVYVVTNAWHMRRALIAFAHTDLVVTAAPTPLDRPPGPILNDFEPRSQTWEVAYYTLHEWIGCAWYELR
jgi:uncharacterized SAM-binding protein YcdF (DUF218 family)